MRFKAPGVIRAFNGLSHRDLPLRWLSRKSSSENGCFYTEKSAQNRFSSFWSSKSQSLTPYIGLAGRLSQIWANRMTLMTIIIIIKVYLFKNKLGRALQDSQRYTLQSCESIQTTADDMALVPQYMSQMANSMVEKYMKESVDAISDGLVLTVTIVEELVVFMVEMTIGTYECLTVSLIDSSVDAAANATESIITFANDSISDITTAVDASLGALTTAFDKLESLVTMVGDFFSGSDNEIASLNKTVSLQLGSFHIPSSINSELESLKKNVPDYATVKNITEEAIKTPFELLKSQISGAKHNISIFDSSASHASEAKDSNLHNICSPATVNEAYSHLFKTLDTCLLVILIILGILALFGIIFAGYKEYCSWKWLRECSSSLTGVGNSMGSVDNMACVINSQSHFRVKVQNFVSRPFKNRSQSTMVLSKWLVAYVTTPTALGLLVLGVLGFLMVALQYIILDVLSAKVPELQKSLQIDIINFDDFLEQEAKSWQQGVNDAINSTEFDINKNMLGWVQTGTTAINDTLTTFMDNMDSAISKSFNGTPLYSLVSSVVSCVIGNKVSEVENAMTWIHDKSQVSFPRVNSSLLTEAYSTNSTSKSSNVSYQKSLTGMSNSSKGLPQSVAIYLRDILKFYRRSLQLELYVAVALFSSWLLIFVVGLICCLFAYLRPKPVPQRVISNPILQDPELQYTDVPPRPSPTTPTSLSNATMKKHPAGILRFQRALSLKARHHHGPCHSAPASPTSYAVPEDDWLTSQSHLPPFLGEDLFRSTAQFSGTTSPDATISEFARTPVEVKPQRARLVNVTVAVSRKSTVAQVARDS